MVGTIPRGKIEMAIAQDIAAAPFANDPLEDCRWGFLTWIEFGTGPHPLADAFVKPWCRIGAECFNRKLRKRRHDARKMMVANTNTASIQPTPTAPRSAAQRSTAGSTQPGRRRRQTTQCIHTHVTM
jgi:hypothetical protein